MLARSNKCRCVCLGMGVSGSQGFGGWGLLLRRGEGPSFPSKASPCACSSRLEPVTRRSSRSCLVLVRRGWQPARLAESWGPFPAVPQALLAWACVAFACVTPSSNGGRGREVLCLSSPLPMYPSAALPFVCSPPGEGVPVPVPQVRSLPWQEPLGTDPNSECTETVGAGLTPARTKSLCGMVLSPPP